MITRILNPSAVALLLIDHVSSQRTIDTSTTSTESTIISTAAFIPPGFSRIGKRDLTEDDKIGISIGVTFALIILVGTTAIYCVIRRRRKALENPQTRSLGPGDNGEEGMDIQNDAGKGKEVYNVNPQRASHQFVLHQAPNGRIYQTGPYPIIPAQTYTPQPPAQISPSPYPTYQPGQMYSYPGSAYPGTPIMSPSQQSSYAGPSNMQYPPEAHVQAQQYQQYQQYQQPQQQQGGDHMGWTYPASAISTAPVEIIPATDLQYRYLQDYLQQPQDTKAGPDGHPALNEEYGENKYNVPPPHPHVSELADERKPVELMGEGHYTEVP
ncbi:hypothetical protein F4808DRAFT_370357 [Astrocystis sublimbata]|nr:hypothetical protein F4808DRAFT_370357 [Astrocystis sublimbata]